MKVNHVCTSARELAADSLVLFVTEVQSLKQAKLADLDAALGGALSVLLDSEEFVGKANQTVTLPAPTDCSAQRLTLVGVGPAADLTDDRFRQAAGTVSRLSGTMNYRTVGLHLGAFDDAGTIQAVVEGYLLGSYRSDEYRTKPRTKRLATEELLIAIDNKRARRRLESSVDRGGILADAQILARFLASRPANLLGPAEFAKRASSIAREAGIKATVLDSKGIAREKLEALAAVGQGSEWPPRFVILEYSGAAKSQRPVVLVGKGMTYDSGGLCIKTAATMPEMKSDMSGAAAVLATLQAVARLKLKLNVVGLLPMAENMPSGTAYRPGDIVGSRRGLTIEVINTDAEGRLILADGLAYADLFEPQALLDIATLTGGALYITGYSGAPIMGTSPKLLERLEEASDRTGERVWRMPIWDDFRDRMKSDLADLKNSGGKPGATMTAGAFLEAFVGDWPWAHIDIASVDNELVGRPYTPKGMTGFGARLLIDLLSNWKKL